MAMKTLPAGRSGHDAGRRTGTPAAVRIHGHENFCRTLDNGHMRIESIAIGDDPPNDVNVIIEVPLGGQPIKYEMDKAAGTLFVDRFLYTPMSYPGTRVRPAYTVRGRRSDRRTGVQYT
jgi:hypothetical protein